MPDNKFTPLHKLNVKEQFAIAKRIGSPMILPFVDMMIKGAKNNVSLAPALIMAMNRMPDEDANYIIEICASKIFDISSNPPASVFRNGQLMYSDLSLSDLLEFSAQIIMRDMMDFLNTVLPDLAQEQQTEA